MRPGCLGRHRRDPKGPARPPARCEGLLSSTCFFKIQEPKSPTFPSKPPGGPNGHSHPAGLPAPRLGPQRLGAAWVGPRLARLKLGTHISAQKLRTNSQTAKQKRHSRQRPGSSGGRGPSRGLPSSRRVPVTFSKCIFKKANHPKERVLSSCNRRKKEKNLRETVPACQSHERPNIGWAPGHSTCRGDCPRCPRATKAPGSTGPSRGRRP